MDVYSLGHASWLFDVAGLRLLVDPLVTDRHAGGVFDVTPPRALDIRALATDFLFVSHRHPDHFDVHSLRALCEVDDEIVVVTPDDLVASAATRIGFRTVKRVPAGTLVELDGARVVTSPCAAATDPECGLLVEDATGVVYDQVDTSIGAPADVRAFFARTEALFGRGVSLALVRWQPLLEVDAALAGRIGFPFAAYADELEGARAIGAANVVPASAGVVHAAPFDAQNRLVYPVTPERYLQDARAYMPRTNVLPNVTGGRYTVAGQDVVLEARGGVDAGLLTVSAPATVPDFRPFEIPAVVDENVDGRPLTAMRAEIDAFVRGALAPALSVVPGARPMRYLLEVVLPLGAVDFYAITVESDATVRTDFDPRWDVRCVISASMLCDVLAGRRHWGEPLLAGRMRACSRAYEVDGDGLRRAAVQPLFLYHALSYERSVERALETALSAHG